MMQITYFSIRVLSILVFLSLGNHVFSKNVSANELYKYAYAKKPIKVNSRQYHKYIKPQLTNIVSNFYTLIKNSKPLQIELFEMRRNTVGQMQDIKNIYLKCFNISFDCEGPDWRELYRKLIELENSINAIELNFKLLDQTQEAFLDDFFRFIPSLRKQISSHLMNFEKKKINNNMTDDLSQDFIQTFLFTRTNFNILLARSIQKSERKIYYSLWKNFIMRIEDHILPTANINKLKNSLEDLSMQWNNFHYQVERDHVKTDPAKKRLIRSMHTRWTLILKVIVG